MSALAEFACSHLGTLATTVGGFVAMLVVAIGASDVDIL